MRCVLSRHVRSCAPCCRRRHALARAEDRDPVKRHLCWIPWNEAVSPGRIDDERYAEGIPCIWLPSPKAAGVILFCHGNAEDLGMCLPWLGLPTMCLASP